MHQNLNCCRGGAGGWCAGGWGAHRVTHKIVQKCVTLMLHNSKSIQGESKRTGPSGNKILKIDVI